MTSAPPSARPDPFEDESKYPGVKIGARGSTVKLGSYYGYGSGIVGLRLFPNPAFDEQAKKRWDPVRYYTDPSYYKDRILVKPYRVGMSCGFCHVGPNPVKPPEDPNQPKWENLSSIVGAQYFWIDHIFAWNPDSTSFVFQLFHTSRPGTLDTSLVSTDNINNPRTMNAVYSLQARLAMALRGAGTSRRRQPNNKQFNDYVSAWSPDPVLSRPPISSRLRTSLRMDPTQLARWPRSTACTSTLACLARSGCSTSTLSSAARRSLLSKSKLHEKNSSYWAATENQTVDMALFMLKGPPLRTCRRSRRRS